MTQRLGVSRRFSLALASAVGLAAAMSARGDVGSTDDVSPANPSTWTSSTTGYVGQSGGGTLKITNSGQVIDSVCYLGANAGATGAVTVDGSGSKWINVSIYLGNSGSGELKVTNGGRVSDNSDSFGENAGATGTATVDGSGSWWTITNDVYLGYYGGGTLNITNGGAVNSGSCYFGTKAGATGTATVDGSGSSWTSTAYIYVGYSGSGSLKVTNGGVVSSSTGDIDGAAGTVTVDGSGSTWINTSGLLVGNSGSGALSVTNGGRVTSSFGGVGYNAGATGTATVDGGGSSWTSSGNLAIGNLGSGALNITNGGVVSCGGTAFVACGGSAAGSINFGANGGTLTTQCLCAGPSQITGTGTINTRGMVADVDLVFDSTHGLNQALNWVNAQQNMTVRLDLTGGSGAVGDLGAGYQGTGSLMIRGGVAVSCGNGFLGYKVGSAGSATVDGSGSTWTCGGSLTIGNSGDGMLNITNGGIVSCGGPTYVAYNGSGTGSINFGPNGGTLTTQCLYATSSQITGKGTIRTRGLVTDNDLVFDATHGLSQTLNWVNAQQNLTMQLDMTGNNGTVGDLVVGYKGTANLTIRDGTSLSCNNGTLGYRSGSLGTATVSGTGSAWTCFMVVDVGYTGVGTLSVNSGGTVSAPYVGIGDQIGSTGSVTVDGTSSTCTDTVGLIVGNLGTGNLSILHGAKVTGGANSGGVIGSQTGSTGGVAVDGAGSKLTDNGKLLVGNFGTGWIHITNGGAVSSPNGYLGYYWGSTGTAVVDGSGSTWTCGGSLTIGNGGTGMLTITNGGLVSNSGNCILGYNNGASQYPPSTSQGTVTVTGSGSAWSCGGSLSVGYYNTGMLLVSGSGSVSSSDGVVGYYAKGTAMVDGSGSTWTCKYLTVGSSSKGLLNVTNGGKVSSTSGLIGDQRSAAGTVTVDGRGSTWTCGGMLRLGYGGGAGTLKISNGGTVTALGQATISSLSLVAINVGDSSGLSVGTGILSYSGVIRLTAIPSATAGTYAPVTAGTWSQNPPSGSVQALGGSWSTSTHKFTVSMAASGTSNQVVPFNTLSTQRVAITDPTTGDEVRAGFKATTTSASVTLAAAELTGEQAALLQSVLTAGASILDGWTFATTGYTEGDPVCLSLKVGAGWSVGDLAVWHNGGASWSAYEASDLSYDGTYASFTVTSFSGYGVVAVPEPAGLAVLVMAVPWVVRRRRRRSKWTR